MACILSIDSGLTVTKAVLYDLDGTERAVARRNVPQLIPAPRHVERDMTDNGKVYRPKDFAKTCRWLHLQHKRTRPYTPRTNGKAERFIQTALRERAYRVPYESSRRRTEALPRWLHFYNHHRKHSALGRLPPASRVNNLLSTNT